MQKFLLRQHKICMKKLKSRETLDSSVRSSAFPSFPSVPFLLTMPLLPSKHAFILVSQSVTVLMDIQETSFLVAFLHEEAIYAEEWSEATVLSQMAEHGFAGTSTGFFGAMLDSLQSQRRPLAITDTSISTELTLFAFPDEGRKDPTADHLAIPLSLPLASNPKHFQRIIRLQTQVGTQTVEPWETVLTMPLPVQPLEIQTLDVGDEIVLDVSCSARDQSIAGCEQLALRTGQSSVRIAERSSARDIPDETVCEPQTISSTIRKVKPLFTFRGSKVHA